MRLLKKLTKAALVLSAFYLVALGTTAEARPQYLHALSDLREAREGLQTVTSPGFTGACDRAIAEIDHAIREVDASVREEGRDPHRTPAPATEGSTDRPMRAALVLLKAARGDIAAGTDDTGHQERQARAVAHVDRALEIIKHALHLD